MTAIRNLAVGILLDVTAMLLVIGAAVGALLLMVVSIPITRILEAASDKRSTMCKKCFDAVTPKDGLTFMFKRKDGRHRCSQCGNDYYVSADK